MIAVIKVITKHRSNAFGLDIVDIRFKKFPFNEIVNRKVFVYG